MKKLSILFTILFILSLLSLLSVASAETVFVQHSLSHSSTDSFYVSSSSSDLSLCSCATGMDSITVVNDGSVPVKVDLLSNLDYVSFSTASVNLIPGQEKLVYVYVHAPCDKSSDVLEITATSVYGKSQLLTRKLSFNKCENLVVIPGENFTAPLCSEFKDSFLIQNTGSFSEEYEVVVKKFDDYSSVNNKIVTIPANKLFNYTVSYLLPCDVSGVNNLEYKITALKNKRVVDFSKEINISQDYNFSISGPANITVCDSLKQSFNLTLVNDNSFEDRYLIKLHAPSFVSLDMPLTSLGLKSNTLILNASSFTEIPLVFEPSGLKDAGYYNISIFVTSLTGDVIEDLVIPVTVSHCYDFSNLININSDEFYVCSGSLTTLDLILDHKGFATPTVDLKLSSPDYVSLLSDKITFNGKEGQKATIIVNSSDDISEDSTVTIDAFFNDELVDSKSFDLKLRNNSECYFVQPQRTNLNVRYDAVGFSIPIKNLGIKDGTYNVLVFDLPYYSRLTSNKITINSSEKATIYFDIDQDELLNSANAFNNGSIIGLEDSFVMVLKRSSGQEFYSDITLNFVNKPWYEWAIINTYSWWNSLTLCFKVLAVLAGLSGLLLIILLFKLILGRRFFSSKYLGLILLVLVIILTISVLVWKGVPTKSMFYTTHDLETNSTIYLKMDEDASRSFDLSDFFFDPDNNIVNYSVTSENDSLLYSSIKGSVLTLEPSRDWNGLTSIELVAIDEGNKSASSGRIFVNVLPVEDYSLIDWLTMACHYFVVILFIVFSLLLYLVFSFRKGIKEVKNEKQLTLNETVVVKSSRPPRPSRSAVKSKSKSSKKKLSKSNKSSKKNKKDSADKVSSVKKSSKKEISKKKTSKKDSPKVISEKEVSAKNKSK